MDAEAAYLEALSLVELFTIEGDQLNLSGVDADLVFVVDETATTTTRPDPKCAGGRSPSDALPP